MPYSKEYGIFCYILLKNFEFFTFENAYLDIALPTQCESEVLYVLIFTSLKKCLSVLLLSP